jgi:hypothetical protein
MPNNYVLLDRIELNDTAASVTFDNIPQSGYTDLKVVYSARTDRANQSSDIYLQFNGITTATYSFRRIYGQGTGGPASDSLTNNSSGGFAGTAVGATATASTFGSSEIYIPNYTSANAKSWSSDGVTENNATGVLTALYAGLSSGTAAITSIAIKDYNAANFVANSTFSLYGLAQVGTTPAIAPKADGGNVIGTDGTYWYHAFLSNGTFTPQVGLTADVLVVAGGGGGGMITGNVGAGGGGAGGLLAFTSQSLAAGTGFSCTVGAGGNGATTQGNGTVGVDSQFGALTLVKGGGRGAYNGAGGTGGSGGGGNGAAGGSATSGQGNAGGSSNSTGVGGGGGGAGTAGGNGVVSGDTGGTAGNGVNTYSAWATATATGVSGYYAGGGGGGGYTGDGSYNPRLGGLGGGGNGWVFGTSATSGRVNTGGGGGGGSSANGTAGNGGSGIVIIRYLVA